MTLPRTAKTVGELTEILSHLPPDMRIGIELDTLQFTHVEVMMDDSWTGEEWEDCSQECIKLQTATIYHKP